MIRPVSIDSFRTVIRRNHTAAKPPLQDAVDQHLAKMREELEALKKGPRQASGRPTRRKKP